MRIFLPPYMKKKSASQVELCVSSMLTGKARVIDDVEAVLEKRIRAFARIIWPSGHTAREYKSRMKEGVVGFEVEVEKVEANSRCIR